jgi:hypothetical protein
VDLVLVTALMASGFPNRCHDMCVAVFVASSDICWINKTRGLQSIKNGFIVV